MDLVVKWEKKKLIVPLKEVIGFNLYPNFLESFKTFENDLNLGKTLFTSCSFEPKFKCN